MFTGKDAMPLTIRSQVPGWSVPGCPRPHPGPPPITVRGPTRESGRHGPAPGRARCARPAVDTEPWASAARRRRADSSASTGRPQNDRRHRSPARARSGRALAATNPASPPVPISRRERDGLGAFPRRASGRGSGADRRATSRGPGRLRRGSRGHPRGALGLAALPARQARRAAPAQRLGLGFGLILYRVRDDDMVQLELVQWLGQTHTRGSGPAVTAARSRSGRPPGPEVEVALTPQR